MSSRRIALASLTPRADGSEGGRIHLPSFGIRRIQAAVMADPLRPKHAVKLFDHDLPDVQLYVANILNYEPDLIGFSIYVWSSECLVAVAREIKRRRPQCLIVFGGPSARSALFDLPFYADPNTYLDALVEGDGEVVFRDIARLPKLDRENLRGVRGVTLPAGAAWLRTPAALDLSQPDKVIPPEFRGLHE